MEKKIDKKFKIYLFIEKFFNSLMYFLFVVVLVDFSFLALIFTFISFLISYITKDISYDFYVLNRDILDKKRSDKRYKKRLKKRGVLMENEK